MMSTRVAVVTGSNKGIGLATVRGLCKKFEGDVILTARDEARGKEAIAKLEQEGLKPKFHQLAIDDEKSIVNLRDFLKKEYGGLDVLVNNAGIAYGVKSTASLQEQAENTLAINYFATNKVCEILFPILKKHARVANLSSFEGRILHIPNAELRAKFNDPNLTMEKLDALIQSYLDDVKAGVHLEKGWSPSTYRMSKIALTALTFVKHRELCKNPDMDIVINACSPGYVNTDMTNQNGTLTTDEGAVSSIFLALLPPNIASPRGEFVLEDCTVSDWNK